jgi:two-component system chemotaxis response regulator CheB
MRIVPAKRLTDALSPPANELQECPYAAVVVGGSAGGMEALSILLAPLPADYPLSVLVAQHLHKSDDEYFARHLDARVSLHVTEARDKEAAEPGRVYVAPADYHLLVERGGTLALSIDPKVNWARPSIDVLFESAARAWADALIGVILSGANEDGAQGMRLIRDLGGRAIAQDPSTAEYAVMPQAAISIARLDIVLPPEAIGDLLVKIALGKMKIRNRLESGNRENNR